MVAIHPIVVPYVLSSAETMLDIIRFDFVRLLTILPFHPHSCVVRVSPPVAGDSRDCAGPERSEHLRVHQVQRGRQEQGK